jgi:MFS family permease
MSVLAGVLALALVRDSPDGKRSQEDAPTWHQVRRDLATAWRHPGTRLGLWTHFTTPFSGTVFAMLWGYPFLISGEGLSRKEASGLFTLFVVAAMTAGPIIGELVARHPLRRSWLVLTIIGAVVALWTAVLALPHAAPLWLLVLLVLALAVSGPGSMISFDYARTFNPPHRIGTASGIVNVGGFVAALVVILLVGVVMNVSGHGSNYTLNSILGAIPDMGDRRCRLPALPTYRPGPARERRGHRSATAGRNSPQSRTTTLVERHGRRVAATLSPTSA